MENYDIYRDIAERTNGDIYIGVVGPVRTGKSTFIKKFMDMLVLPNIENAYARERAKDELPQSAGGKIIMTTEPKFVPNEAVEIGLGDAVRFKVRMIDCVGFLVDGAEGHMSGDTERMVNTPWYENKIPFAEAAEIGTKKVINEHATLGILVTTDGSIADISREAYAETEARVVEELKNIKKPFIMILNTTTPYAPESAALRDELEMKYNVPVMPVNCMQLKQEDINAVMEKALMEFPIKEIRINVPKWVETLIGDHWLKKSLIESTKDMMKRIAKLNEIRSCVTAFEQNEFVKKAYLDNMKPGDGSANIEINLNDELFYHILSETTGMDISGEYQLISTIKVLAEAKHEYDKIKFALEEVKHRGYGIVTPSMDEMTLEAPQLVKHGSRYGVKIKASAPSLHIIQANIETEVSPIVGTEQQSQELIDYLASEMKTNPEKVWELNMFGKSMHDMVKEGLQNKLFRMPEDAQMKFQESLQKIINEGSGGLICILL